MAETKIQKKSVLLGQRSTEKAALKAAKDNVHVFNVTVDATKKSVIASIKAQYKVTPTDVRLVTIPSKKVFWRGRPGVKSGGKKAYIALKKGDKIENV
jgi:large subunit ribosomal protein L23